MYSDSIDLILDSQLECHRRLEWTFDYNEVFFVLEGSLEIQENGQTGVTFHPGDLGYIEKGTSVVITVPERAYLLHVT